MKEVKRWWGAVVLGLLLMATLGGAVVARPSARPEAASGSTTLTVPAAAFIPQQDTLNWFNNGNFIRLDSGTGVFTAPVYFPGTRTITKITLYAYDNNPAGGAAGAVCAALGRVNPVTGVQEAIGWVCSTGASATDPRAFTDTTITPNEVRPKFGTYVAIAFGGWSNLKVYGVKITYTK